jgi:hypothetical protein
VTPLESAALLYGIPPAIKPADTPTANTVIAKTRDAFGRIAFVMDSSPCQLTTNANQDGTYEIKIRYHNGDLLGVFCL